MSKTKLLLLSTALLFCCTEVSFAQSKKKKDAGKEAPKVEQKAPEKKGPKPYNKVVDSTAVTQKGLFNIHKTTDNKFLFEINDTLIGKEIMTITRYSKTPAGGGVFGGEEVNRQVIKWEKGLNNNLLLRSITHVITSPERQTYCSSSKKFISRPNYW